MGIFVKDKSFYKQLVMIVIPVAIQNLIAFAVAMSDTVMVGMLGEVQLSAVSLANQLGFIYTLVCFGAGEGSLVLISQFWGKGDIKSIHKVITVMYRVLVAAALFFTVLATVFPRQVMMVFTTDAEVVVEAVKFLRVVGLSYLFAGLASSTIIMFRAVRSVRISLVVYPCSLVICVFLNWVLIFGNLGAPALGVVGAAISTCIARTAEVIIVFIYMRVFEKKIGYKFKSLFIRKVGILRNYIQNALPVTINELLWGTGMAAIAVIIGRIGREFTAANAIATVLSQLVTVVLFGVANASSVIIGNTIGKGKYDLAKSYAKTILAISFLLGLVSCAVVLALKNPILSLYSISPLTRIYANQIMTIYAFLVIFISLAATTLVGILRGGGDTRFVLLLDLVFMWFICIPAGFLTGLYLGWPVWAVYIIIKCDEICKVVCALIRILRGNWINDVTIR